MGFADTCVTVRQAEGGAGEEGREGDSGQKEGEPGSQTPEQRRQISNHAIRRILGRKQNGGKPGGPGNKFFLQEGE